MMYLPSPGLEQDEARLGEAMVTDAVILSTLAVAS